MTATRKAHVPMAEQIRLINECRQSGMTDADWCRENGIAVSTFYNWVSRCRKTAADQIPAPNYGHCVIPRSKQDVVPIDIVPDRLTEQHIASQMHQTNLDNSHTIEVSMNDVTIRISNDADPVLLTRTLRLIRETAC
jgi:transposase-like protein